MMAAVVSDARRRQQGAAGRALRRHVLVGTISIETSEMLSGKLKKVGLKHTVLNAKKHESESEIVAQAGRKGAITISTNMAGRGTDILLGGNPDAMAGEEAGKPQLAHDGHVYHFCHEGCRAKFEADPDRYLPSKTQALTMAAAPGPAAKDLVLDPVCGMRIDPATEPAAEFALDYVRLK